MLGFSGLRDEMTMLPKEATHSVDGWRSRLLLLQNPKLATQLHFCTRQLLPPNILPVATPDELWAR
jgi:hypothetical protein